MDQSTKTWIIRLKFQLDQSEIDVKKQEVPLPDEKSGFTLRMNATTRIERGSRPAVSSH